LLEIKATRDDAVRPVDSGLACACDVRNVLLVGGVACAADTLERTALSSASPMGPWWLWQRPSQQTQRCAQQQPAEQLDELSAGVESSWRLQLT
jgi:hypothetical protein